MSPAISRALVRETLNRILASPSFEKSGRARELLQYLVDEELEERGGQIKGFTIAVDVFGRDAGFDASNDPLVRVHVGRLRELLTQYYVDDGANDAVRIRIPKGGYRPDFQLMRSGMSGRSGLETGLAIAAEAETESDDFFADDFRKAMPANFKMSKDADGTNVDTAMESNEKVLGVVMRHVRAYWAAIGLIIVMLGYLLYSQLAPDGLQVAGLKTGTAEASTPRRGHRGTVTSDLLPGIAISVEGNRPDLQKTANELIAAIARFDVVQLVRTNADGEANAARSISYRFRVLPGAAEKQTVVNLENMALETVLLSETLVTEDDALPLNAQLSRLLTRTLGDSGVVFADMESTDTGNSLTDCLLLNQSYYRDPSDLAHRKAYDCFRQLSLRGARSPLVYSELAALTHEAVTDKLSYPVDASEEGALKLAEKALALGPESPHAHRAMSFVLSKTGNGLQSVVWAKKAHDLNPYNLDLTASYGYAQAMTEGDFAGGQKLLRDAVDSASSVQPWWVYGLVLSLYMTGDVETAYSYADRMRTRNSGHYVAVRMILAHETGNTAEAEELLAKLVSGNSAFAKDPAAFCKEARYPAALSEKILEGLRKAGFSAAG